MNITIHFDAFASTEIKGAAIAARPVRISIATPSQSDSTPVHATSAR